MGRLIALLATLVLVVAPLPARAGTRTLALPGEVRINIGLEGTSYAVISATGPFVVRSPEGPAVLRTVPCRFVPLLGAEGFNR